MREIRVELPAFLRRLAGIAEAEVRVSAAEPVTVGTVVDALELRWPQLGGTMRDYHTRERRAMIRFFAEEEDLSMLGMEAGLPERVLRGEDVLIVLGAIAGG